MKLPADGDDGSGADLAERLLAICLERMDLEGDSALESLCGEYPGHAEKLRADVAALRGIGFVRSNSAASASFVVPERLGEYRLLRRIGGGGMGLVFLAERASDGQRVAFKVIRPEHLHSPRARERFRREVDAAGRLRHPGIAPILGAGEDRGFPYFVMEWIEGSSLSDVLRAIGERPPESLRGLDFLHAIRPHDPVPSDATSAREWERGSWIDVAIDVVRQVALALDHAHGEGVIHRDVKPSNILVTRAGRVSLVDFGLASLAGADGLTRTGDMVGSLPYMAPEQVRGAHAEVDGRSDVFALGVTLFEFLALRGPFASDSAETTRTRILSGIVPPLRSLNRAVSRDLETVCRKAIERRPSARYATAGAFAEDLDRARDGRRVRARRPGLAARAAREVERHPRAAVGAVVLALSSVILVLAARSNRGSDVPAHLADAQALSALDSRAREFWPADPSLVPAMRAWCDEAALVLAREAARREELVTLRERALPYESDARERDRLAQQSVIESIRAELREQDGMEAVAGAPDAWMRVARPIRMENLRSAEARLGQRGTWTFGTTADERRHAELSNLLASFAELSSLAERVRDQVSLTLEIERLRASLGASDERIVLRSGSVNGRPGNPRESVTSVRCIAGTSQGLALKTGPFGEEDFQRAEEAPHPTVVNMSRFGGEVALPSDADARWMNWSAENGAWGTPPRSVLYAQEFAVATPRVAFAMLVFRWSVDDFLGDFDEDRNPVGVFLNGHRLSAAFERKSKAVEHGVAEDVTSLLVAGGRNVLYVYQRDTGGGVSGVIYSAEIEIWVSR